MAELLERGVALVAGDQDVPAVLVIGPDADRRQLPEQRDRLGERIDLLGEQLLPDVLVVPNLAQRDHPDAGDHVGNGGHQALLRLVGLRRVRGPDSPTPGGRQAATIGRGPDAARRIALCALSAACAPNAPLFAVGAARYDQAMSGVPADLPPGSAVVLTNPDEDASPEAFRAFIDELLAGPEPELESVDAAEALRALRVDAQA